MLSAFVHRTNGLLVDIVRMDVVTSDNICNCYRRFNYWDCIDYEACKDEIFVADNRADIEDYQCTVDAPETEDMPEYHNDWSRWYTYNFWRYWSEETSVNATGYNWEDLFTTGETEGTIGFGERAFEDNVADLDRFSNKVEEVLQTECERQVSNAGVEYDCTSVNFDYAITDSSDEQTLVVAFYFSSGYVLQLSIALLSSVALFFLF
jgi:hypothetical protein